MAGEGRVGRVDLLLDGREDLLLSGGELRAAIRHGTLLIIAIVILIVATAVLPSDSWIVLGLLTTVLLVPWILLFPANRSPKG
jgi:hypothetical protein